MTDLRPKSCMYLNSFPSTSYGQFYTSQHTLFVAALYHFVSQHLFNVYIGRSSYLLYFCYNLLIGWLTASILSIVKPSHYPRSPGSALKITLFTKYFWHSERIRGSHLNFMTQKPEAALEVLALEGTLKCHHKF